MKPMDRTDIKDLFIDVGGYSLHARLRGTGTPTIVFESGLGDDLLSWYKVQPALAEQACTLSYDRAGLGESGSSPRPRTISFMVEDLHTLLARAKLPPPYMIVGHSLGGFIARLFAHRFPQLVCGLVLVDPAHEGQSSGMQALRSAEQWQELEKQGEARMQRAPAGVRAEFKQLEKNIQLMASVRWMPQVPTTILTSIRFNGDDRRMGILPEDKLLWQQLHEGWLEQVPQARHILTKDSGHYIHVEQPELVIEAIREMLSTLTAEPGHLPLQQ